MIVRMVHPEHGATHVYDDSELERLRKYGWAPEGEAQTGPIVNGDTSRELEDALATAVPVEIVSLPVVDAPPRRKPGRPRKGE
jgi:hypothetical protein